MMHKNVWGIGLLVALAAGSVGHAQQGAPPVLIYGQNSGTLKPVATDANGNIQIAGEISVGDLSVGAQPATDPHFVQCSNGTTAAACDVAVTSSALPTGASTAANQSTIIGHVDGIETVLGTIDADTGGILTAVQLIDNAIAGSEMQVDVVSSALPTGAATAANQSTVIGHVDGVETLLGTIDTDTGAMVTALQLIDNAISGSGINISAIGGVAPAASACEDPSKVDSVAIDTASSGNVQLVALNGSEVVYACGYNFMSAGTVNVRFVSGTGTACATGETAETGLYPLLAQTGVSVSNGGSVQFKGAAGNAMCIELSAAIQVSGVFTYVRQ